MIEASPDGRDWQVVHEHGAEAPVLSADSGLPGVLIFMPPVAAAHLRLRKLDRGVLHLRCIKAFGMALDYGLVSHHAAARMTP